MTKFEIKEINSSRLEKSKITVKKVKDKLYRQYDAGYFFNCLIEYASMKNEISITSYLKTKKNISKSSFLRYYNKSGLAAYKQQGTFDTGIAKTMLTAFFETTNKNSKSRILAAQDSICYLTANEEPLLVQLCTVLGAMGYGLTCNDLHCLADDLINQDVDECQKVSISKHVTEGLLQQHKDLVKVVAAASLDPKLACQATVKMRDTMFSKLTAYIELLYATGKIPWKTYSDILAEAIFNMDELGNDTTKHQNKILTKKQQQAVKKSIQHVSSCGHQKGMATCHGI